MTIRVLFVLGLDVEVDVSDYQNEMGDFNVVMIRENDQFLRIMCEHDPQVIVSLGNVGQMSYLWSMPLWRRSRWLNLPDGKVSAEVVRLAALSLVAGTCGGELFPDEPLFACVALDENPHEVARAIAQVSDTLDYDNIEFLVTNDLFYEVISLLGNHSAVGALRHFHGSSDSSPLELLRNAIATTRAKFLWPISAAAKVTDPNLLWSVVDVVKQETGAAVIIGNEPSRESVLSYLDGIGENPVGQFIFSPEHVFRVVQFEHDFPLTSLSGLLLSIIGATSTRYVQVESTSGVTPDSWWTEADRNHQMFLQACINFTKQLQQA